MYGFIEAIELIVRTFFNVEEAHVAIQVDTSLKKRVLDAVISSDAVLEHWKIVAGCIPKKYEQYSVCLLKVIAEFWINIRGHSFAQGWTMMFESKYGRGIRKTLKQREK